MCCVLSRFICAQLFAILWTIARLLCPWDSPGNNTEGVSIPSSWGSSQPFPNIENTDSCYQENTSYCIACVVLPVLKKDTIPCFSVRGLWKGFVFETEDRYLRRMYIWIIETTEGDLSCESQCVCSLTSSGPS